MGNAGIGPLASLCQIKHPVADLVSDYLRTADDWSVDDWFNERTQNLYANPELESPDSSRLEYLSTSEECLPAVGSRMRTLHPNFFRGFRKLPTPIDLSGDLIVIDGRNSAGKTSLAEALEWVLTGEIVRRRSGDPKELSNCIANRFKPANEETWVECVVEQNGTRFTLKRCLVTDYNSTKNSRCESQLLVNGHEVTEPTEILNVLFGGVPPLLLQHTLRQFVLDNPIERRNYFERLLNLDDITSLIQKAVVGDIGRGNYSRPGGGNSLKIWQDLEKSVNRADASNFGAMDIAESESIYNEICRRLHTIGVEEFSLESDLSIESMVERLKELQISTLQGKFPMLEKLRPHRTLDHETRSQLSGEKYEPKRVDLVEAMQTYRTALYSTKQLSAAQYVISTAIHELRLSGLIQDVEQEQICPFCEYREFPTLTKRRIAEVSDWNDLGKVVTKAKSKLVNQKDSMTQIVKGLIRLRYSLIPHALSPSEWESAADPQIEGLAKDLQEQHEVVNRSLSRFDELTAELICDLESEHRCDHIDSKLKEMFALSGLLISSARTYASAFQHFERTLDKLASSDQTYTARKYWIEVWNNSDELVADLRWGKRQNTSTR